MFLVRLLLWVITLPLVIIAYVFKLILFLLTAFGSIVTTLLGGVLVIASAVMFIGCFFNTGAEFWSGIGTSLAGIALGIFIYYMPRIGAFLIALCDSFIHWVRSITFG
ncbi:MAG: hypothetical protein IJX23_02745 [Clostridia bacterium]|nr:hypothetical protein [Clostridia bacterium]